MKTILASLTAAIAIIAGASTAQAEPKQTLMPVSERGKAFFEEFGFSEAVIHNGTVYLSGVIVGPATEELTEAQAYDKAFQYLGFVLKRAGSSWDDVLDITTYHVDIKQSMPAFLEAKGKVIKAPFPAWTAIDVDRLYADDGVVEIKITARVTPKDEEPAE